MRPGWRLAQGATRRFSPLQSRFFKSMPAAISFSNVTKSFKTEGEPIPAFGPAGMTVDEGGFVTLLGPSGCGKSTLLLMIAGLILPTTGTIVMNGEAVTGPRHDIGMMFQDSTLVPWRSVLGNIRLQLEMRGLDINAYENKTRELISSVSLSGYEHLRPHELSGGMQQRAALCQALIHEPKTLLLDEPLGKLDAMTRENIRKDLQTLWMNEKPTVLMVTHSIEEAVQMSSQVCIITPRPGLIDKTITIDLPWPRNLEVKRSRLFADYMAEIQEVFQGYGVI